MGGRVAPDFNMAGFPPEHLSSLRKENLAIVARIEAKTKLIHDWTSAQLAAATAAGQRLVLQPETNMNNHVGGIAAYTGMRVQGNPAFFALYANATTDHTDFMRWGMARGKGTIVGTSDDNSEVRVKWDDDRRVGCNIKAGKQGQFWLMTV